MLYKFFEYEWGTPDLKPTGRVAWYQADSPLEAARHCLYTQRLTNGYASLGKSELTVFTGRMAWGYAAEKVPSEPMVPHALVPVA